MGRSHRQENKMKKAERQKTGCKDPSLLDRRRAPNAISFLLAMQTSRAYFSPYLVRSCQDGAVVCMGLTRNLTWIEICRDYKWNVISLNLWVKLTACCCQELDCYNLFFHVATTSMCMHWQWTRPSKYELTKGIASKTRQKVKMKSAANEYVWRKMYHDLILQNLIYFYSTTKDTFNPCYSSREGFISLVHVQAL